MNLAGRRFFRFTLCALICCAGCASFQSEDDALLRYSRTRQEMDRLAQPDRSASPFDELAQRKQQERQAESAESTDESWQAKLKRMIGQGPSKPDAERLYQEGLSLYGQALPLLEQRSLEQAHPLLVAAADSFIAAGKRWPKSSLEQNALYYAGEAYFFADRYPKANDQFELLLKRYPNSRYMDHIQQRRFAIAQFWYEKYSQTEPGWYVMNVTDSSRPLNDLFGRAMKILDRIRLDDPTGKLADDATLALANAYMLKGKYYKADEYYTDLRRTFPSSEHQFAAHFVGLKCKLLIYEGADYSSAPLEDAEKLIETIRRQFPAEAEHEQDFLKRALAETRYKKAEREYHMAQYFDQKAEYGAAKQYYAVVVNDYGDTSFANDSRARVAELGGLPDMPPQRMEWLVDLFPREENNRPLIGSAKPKSVTR